MRRPCPIRFFLPLAAIALVVAGCQTTTTQQPPPISNGESGDSVFSTDPSAQRLEAINEDLLIYVRSRKVMPTTLADLQQIDPDVNLFTPGGDPFTYIPTGLAVAGSPKLLIVYDPSQNANGRHWSILVSSLRPDTAMVTEVMDLTDAVVQQYLKYAQ